MVKSKRLKRPRDEATVQDRAQRVLNLRKLLGYSRQKFCDKYAKYGINASTLQTWEKVRWNGLSESGAELLVKAFKDEGLEVTVKWLLFGVGESPLKDAEQLKLASAVAKISEDETVQQELRFYHQINANAIDAIISDDNLAPWLSKGDRVAGRCLKNQDIEKAIDYLCIVQTLTEQTLVGWLKPGEDAGHYTLVYRNQDANAEQPILENTPLISAAPVAWIRKSSLPI